MKLGIIIDSSAGLSEEQANKKGWKLLPLFLTIDGKDYADGIDIDANEYYNMISIENDVRTSATPPGLISDMFEKASKEFDQVIVYGLSSKLSSQTNNLKTFSKEFNNIRVIDSLGVGSAIVKNLEVAEQMAKDGSAIEEIIKKMNALTKEQYGLAFVGSMKWLVKGGRISPAAASMANLLKIVPILSFENGELDKYGKGRVFEKTVSKTAKSLIEEHGENRDYLIYHGKFDGDKQLINDLKEILGSSVTTHYFPPVIANHTGPEVMAIMAIKK